MTGFTPRVEIRQYATAELEKMSDADLLHFTFHWDKQRAYMNSPRVRGGVRLSAQEQECEDRYIVHNDNTAFAEVTARYGAGATDRLADYFIASHASYSDRRDMADWHTQLLVDIARGIHTHDQPTRNKPFCTCGHRDA